MIFEKPYTIRIGLVNYFTIYNLSWVVGYKSIIKVNGYNQKLVRSDQHRRNSTKK